MERYQWCGPASVAKAPDADSMCIHARLATHCIPDSRNIIGPLAWSVEKPVTGRFAHAALVVADNVDSVANKEGNDEAHFSGFWIVAMDEDHSRTWPVACIIKREADPPLDRFNDVSIF